MVVIKDCCCCYHSCCFCCVVVVVSQVKPLVQLGLADFLASALLMGTNILNFLSSEVRSNVLLCELGLPLSLVSINKQTNKQANKQTHPEGEKRVSKRVSTV